MSTGFDVGMVDGEDMKHDIPFDFDADGKTTAAITVVGKNSQAYKDADRMLTRVALKKSSARGRALDLKKDSDADEFMDQRENTDIGLAVAVTVGWFGLTNAGQEYPFSEAAAKALYKKNPTVRAKVLAAIEDQASFLKR